MSAIRDPATITKTGRQMVTAGGDITYTKAVLYGQDISHLTKEQVEGLTSIGDPLVTVPIGISDKNDDGNGTTVVLEATFQNSNLKADLPYKAVGFFAKKDDGDEKLVLVGVATDGAYLAATSPDGVSTDSLDIKIAVAVGDASNVTAVVDPAGSVTPATLNGAISKATHDLTDKINTKADKTDLDSQIGIVTKSVSDLSDTVKANKDDTDKALATKADKADLDPLATKADVASDVKTLNDAIDTKASQADLDKTNATVATKASTKDVNTQLATKANSSDVNTALAKKDNITDVDAKIKTVTDLANTKADASDTYNKKAVDDAFSQRDSKITNAQNTATQASQKADDNFNKRPVINGAAGDDLFAYKSNQLRLYPGNGQNCKNLPPASNTTWYTVEYIFETPNNDGVAIYRSPLPEIWVVGNNGGKFGTWHKLADDDDFNNLKNQINTKADKATVDAEISKIDFTPYAKTADVNKEIKTVTDLANTKVGADYSYSKAELDKKLLALSTDTSGKVNASQVASMIAGKADKTDVDQKIATVNKSVSDLSDTVSANKTATDASLATKANASDVADNVKTLQANIDTKADKATVNAEIAKIDFTPYAKSADVDSKLKGYTDTADLTKLLAGKADSDFSYSKAELDKKLLDLTTTTGGKVDASQVATMIENKADKSDVTKQIGTVTDLVNTKANSTDVTAALDKKDDITDVDAKIKKVTDLANKAQSTADSKVKSNWAIDNSNGKFVAANVPAVDTATQSFTQTGLDLLNTLATKSQVADAKNTANQAIDDYNKRPVIRGNDGDDLLAYKTNQLRLYVDVKNCKNLPPASNTQWFTVEYIFENPNGDGVAIFRSPASEVWLNGNNGGSYGNWLRLANDGDINSLQSAINTKANSSDLTALDKKAVKSVGIYPNNLHFESGSFNYWSREVKASPDANGYALIDLTDDTPVRAAADQLNAMLTGLNHLQGKQTKDSADANALSETGVYYCSSPAKNFPVGQWGTLVTSNGNGARASQFYFPDDNSAVWFRTLDGEWRGWVRLANIDDVNNAESSLTSLINAVSNKVNVTVPLFRRITAGNTWNDILGASNGDTPVLVSIRDEGGANTLGNYSAAVAFGGRDTKGVLNVAYSDHTARIIGGNGNAPVWHEDIAWKSDIDRLQSIINQQNQTIQSLTTRLANAENEIRYIKANYVEGRTFPASQEAQANSWENANPQRIAFIEK